MAASLFSIGGIMLGVKVGVGAAVGFGLGVVVTGTMVGKASSPTLPSSASAGWSHATSAS